MQKQKGVSTLVGIIITVVAAVILFGGVFAYQYFAKSQTQTSNVQPKILSNNEIARQLISDWLSKYESSDVVDNERIIDYKINSITIAKTESNCFGFNADFSVKTYLSPNNSWWVAGNGVMGSGNWINNKSLAINALKQNNIYKIIGAGTAFGPGSCSLPSPSFIGEPDKKINTQNPTDQTAGWKTYTNTEYGFEMKLPLSFSVEPIISVKNCEYNNFSLQCPPASDVYQKLTNPIGPNNTPAKRITSDNTPICIYSYGDCGMGSCRLSYWYISAKDNKCLVVDVEGAGTTSCGVYGGPEEPNYKACEKRNADTLQKLNQDIPSTFKFTK